MAQSLSVSFAGQLAFVDATSTITRPSDTTQYTSGDLVANSTTAGSVAALTFPVSRLPGDFAKGEIVGCRIQKSTNAATSAAFRLHLFSVVPTFTSAGDNSAISSVVVASAKGYLGYVDVAAMTGFSDVAWGTGAPDNSRQRLVYFGAAAADALYGVIEARGTYTPASAEVFTVTLFVEQ